MTYLVIIWKKMSKVLLIIIIWEALRYFLIKLWYKLLNQSKEND